MQTHTAAQIEDAQRVTFKKRLLAALRAKLATDTLPDGTVRPPSLTAVYERTVAKLEAELSA